MQGEVQDTGFGGMVKRVAQRVELGSAAGHAAAEPAAQPAVPKPPTPRSGPQPPPPQAKAAATAAAAPQAAADEHGGGDDYSVYSYSDDGYGKATGQGEPEV